MDWTLHFAARTSRMKRSAIREILKLTAQPDVISFAGGLPAPEFFPVERMKEATDNVLSEFGQQALQYSTTEGLPELRQLIADRLSGRGLVVGPEHVVIVGGSQQALDLIGRVMLNEHAKVVVENPSYLGMFIAWNPYYLNYLPVPTDHDGMLVDKLEPLLKQNPAMIYAVPNFQNPQGTTLSVERRKQLVKLLAEYNIPLLEDNAYGELCYSGEPRPSLLQLDAENLGINTLDGHVIYAGTFSKVLTPGLRIGWVAGPEPVIDKIVQAKQAADLHTSPINQYVTYAVAKDGFLDNHITKLIDVYRERRDIMLQAMEDYFPEGVRWTKPDGGLFLMVWLPEGIDAGELLKKALDYKVAFVPGADFHTDGIGANTFRLNFSNAKPEMLREGVRRLGDLIKAAIVQQA